MMARFVFVPAFVALSILSSAAHAAPDFTDIKRSIEGARVEGAKVLYWDQMLADDLGIVTKRGRVGQAAFEQSVVDQIALLIKENPEFMDGSRSAEQPKARGPRFVEIELDAHGGSGRAGFIKLKGRAGKEIWVNIKGIGLTGLGNARNKPVGPPLETYGDHSDGSADLPEGIVEAVNAHIASNNLKYGGGRILSLVTINKDLHLENDVKYPLVLIVRAPMRRMDRELNAPVEGSRALDRIAESLAQANTMRIFKGDFVNQSNIGAGGEFYDFGLFTVVNGFVPAKNYLKVTPFKETNYLFSNNANMKSHYHTAIGYHLLAQLGLEEPRLKIAFGQAEQTIVPRQDLMQFATEFINLMYGENKEVSAEDSGTEKARELDGNFKLHRFFRELAFDTLNSKDSVETLVDSLYAKALKLNEKPTEKFEANFKAFATSAVKLIRQATFDVRGDYSYALKVKTVAEFKNRDLRFLDKRTLREWSVDVMEDYVRTKDETLVQKAIEGAVNRAKLGTNDFTTTEMKVSADDRATYLDIKAYANRNQQHGLFSYPEFDLLASREPRYFKVSVDGKKTSSILRADLIRTSLGLYYRISVPHGSMPVTDQLTSVIPMGAKSTNEAIEIMSAPLMLNERLGLPKAFERVPSVMRTRYGVTVDTSINESKALRVLTRPRVVRSCQALFSF